MENETNEDGHDEDIETNDDGSVTTYDEDYIQSLESKNYSVSLPCLRERVVVMHKITSKRDLDALEKSVRVMLKCDFGACLALETASYSRMRSKMLRLLRTNSPTLEFQTPERIYIAQNFILEFVWDEFKISIVEKPQQQNIESEHEIRFFLSSTLIAMQWVTLCVLKPRTNCGKRQRETDFDQCDVSAKSIRFG